MKHLAAVSFKFHFPNARSLRKLTAVDRTEPHDIFEGSVIEDLIRQFSRFAGLLPPPLLQALKNDQILARKFLKDTTTPFGRLLRTANENLFITL